jgi:hypothetical protein
MNPLIRIRTIVCAAAFLLTASALGYAQGTGPLRIGTYDSRAVALAYYNSAEQQKTPGLRSQLQSEYAQAKAGGDEKKIKELEAAGIAWQQLMHEQAFSTGSISNVIAVIKDKLPDIARQAGVTLLVSKWDVAYRDPSVEYVDVTMPVVRLFSPGDKVLTWIEEMKKQDPVPIDKLPRDVMK